MVKNEVGTFLTDELFHLKIYWGKWQIKIIKKKKAVPVILEFVGLLLLLLLL